ncbi:cytochrome C oxidase subunit I [Herbaspirillum sp. SJZ099]|uniref:SCO family protein n=1 Tax=Herbaspirillum sp. SJZ099 TaxID=2572916 RepID=UPI0011A3B92B|nr:cytochrome C oxidase subunit I [Herbaspirillum sp. SJZ099]TWC69867.1 cytochrome oxidase Cu insertion factor (SCO1/SenC/PrrC family) [Herbaspirillum sp. SJZ099]
MTNLDASRPAAAADDEKRRRRGRWKMLLVVLVCAAPMIASYFTYYVIKPESRNNYGTLIDPRQYPIPDLGSSALDGDRAGLEDYKGKWIMLQVDSADCAAACRNKLFTMRQLRLMQGKDMERIERVWLVTDKAPVETMLIREYDGTDMLRVDAARLKAWLPVEAGGAAEDHIYLIDPLGNLMMRFPKDPDPGKMKKDISKLLRASAIG